MEKVCKELKEHATQIINYEKNEMIPLIKQEKKYILVKKLYIRKRWFSTENDNKKYHKVRDHCHYTGKYRGAVHDIYNLRYKISK